MLLLSDAAAAAGIAAAVPVVDDWSGGDGGNSIRDGSGLDHMGLEKLNMFKNLQNRPNYL